MKYLLLFVIRVYWLLPEERRRRCLFKKSCSKYVFEITSEKGLLKGLKALLFRYQNCRGNFAVFQNPDTGTVQIILNSQAIVDGEEIADRVLLENNVIPTEYVH